ncbi:MAG: CoA transferase, partial [Candidatus Binatia bacterium]|nr:CoA transferase [Candidatus Binatia bacterium]
MAGALEGIRVIELAQGIAGPYPGMLLVEQGAEVIKLEPPHGDVARGTPGFHIWNRSKQSVIADLETSAGYALVQQLLVTANVVLTDPQSGAWYRISPTATSSLFLKVLESAGVPCAPGVPLSALFHDEHVA